MFVVVKLALIWYDEGEDAFSEGHYTDDMTFEPDSFGGSLGERYDCLDDSDSCASCEESL